MLNTQSKIKMLILVWLCIFQCKQSPVTFHKGKLKMKVYEFFFGPVEMLRLFLLGFNSFPLLCRQFLPSSVRFMEKAITPSRLTSSPSFWRYRAQVRRSEKDPVILLYPPPGDAELHPIICLPRQSLLFEESGHRTDVTSFSDPTHTLPWVSLID